MTNRYGVSPCWSNIIFTVALCVSATCVFGTTEPDKAAAKVILERFCQAELEADDIKLREQIIMLSRGRKAELQRKKGPVAAIVLDVREDPLYVVSSCQIGNITLTKNGGKATVKYKRQGRQYSMAEVQEMGSRPRLLPKIVPDYKEVDTVQLTLIKRNNRWWVLDPPIAHVSRAALIKNYEDSTECVDQSAESLKQACLEARENLKVLKEFPQ